MNVQNNPFTEDYDTEAYVVILIWLWPSCSVHVQGGNPDLHNLHQRGYDVFIFISVAVDKILGNISKKRCYPGLHVLLWHYRG